MNSKKKIIDLKDDTFRGLSILAAANGKNLKAYIEGILDEEARVLEEEVIYKSLLKDPESQEIIPDEEKERFENWLGL